ncbi:MAG TPA: ABC transporter permease subunit [Caulobacteraceae bacterium]|nr:ABC transporter permease subunit [Caulobacteraceae bacterium]
MLRFLLRRLLTAIPTLFLVVTVAFFMMRAAPGGPFDGQRKLPPAVEKNVMAKYGLNKPLGEQYVGYLGGVLHGDFGPSLKYAHKSVVQLLAQGFPASAMIGTLAMLLASVGGVALGAIAALRRNRPIDYAVMTFAVLGLCIPTFVIAPTLVFVLASRLGLLPTGGWPIGGQSLTEAATYLVLPILVLALPEMAVIARLTRSGMIESLTSNHVRTARARGLPEHVVVIRHALRGALLPLVSYLGPAVAGVITGSLIVEQIFQLPGIGRYFVISALQRDYPVVMGVVVLYAALILVLNLVADLLYAALDPRVRLS